MKLTVLWKPTAEKQLAELWNAAPDRQAYSKAANLIERLLKTDPEAGELRPGNTRILRVAPLAVRYRILEKDGQVQVVGVWRYRPRI
jgi:hypothetical protein